MPESSILLALMDVIAERVAGELADTRGVPTISTDFPWTGWKFSRGATQDDLAEKSFPYTYHFCWGATEVVKNFLPMWNKVNTNKVVGTFYIDTPTGRAFASPKVGLGGGMVQNGYNEIAGGFFKYATDDFTNQMTAFKNAGAQIVSGLALAHPLGDLLEPGGAGRLPARGLHDHRGLLVRQRRHRAGAARRRDVDRGVVDAEVSVQVLTHRQDGA